MTTQTRTPKKTGPKAASKTTAKSAPKVARKASPEVAAEVAAAPKAEAVAEPKVVALAAVEEAAVEEAAAVETSTLAAVATSAPAAAVEKPAAGNYDDLAAVQQDGVDAFVKAGEVFAKGAEELTRTCFGLCQDVATAQAEAVAAMLAAKSLEEFVGLQNELARKTFDRSIAEGTRISEMSLKIANEAFEPIQTQLTVAVEKAIKPLAA